MKHYSHSQSKHLGSVWKILRSVCCVWSIKATLGTLLHFNKAEWGEDDIKVRNLVLMTMKWHHDDLMIEHEHEHDFQLTIIMQECDQQSVVGIVWVCHYPRAIV